MTQMHPFGNTLVNHVLQVLGIDRYLWPGTGFLMRPARTVEVPPHLAALVDLPLDGGHGVAALLADINTSK